MRATRLVPVLVLLLGAPVASMAQEPSDCRARFGTAWAQQRKFLLSLPPDDPAYRPFPYPKNDEQVAADLRASFLRLRQGFTSADQLPEQERELYGLIKSGDFTVTVTRVENWDPGRCDPKRENGFYFLVSVFSTVTGLEAGRVAVAQDGHVMTWLTAAGHRSAVARSWWNQSLLPVEQLVPRFSERYGIDARSPRYVSTTGSGMACHVIRPCVVFDSGGQRFLFDPRSERDGPGVFGALYEELPQRRLPAAAMATPQGREDTLRTVDRGSEVVTSFGGDGWLVWRSVPTRTVPPSLP